MARPKKSAPVQKSSNESLVSIILGALIVIVVGVIVFNYFSRINKKEDLISQLPASELPKDITPILTITEEISITPVPTEIILPTQKPTLKPTALPTKIPTVTLMPTKIVAKSATPTPVVIRGLPAKYTVKAGDDLWDIAERYYKSGYNWVDIAKANKLKNPDIIETGKILTLPKVAAKEGTILAEAAFTNGPKAITTPTYKVVEGDDLWSISVRACGDGYKWTKLAGDNKIVDPDIIYPDNVLRINCK